MDLTDRRGEAGQRGDVDVGGRRAQPIRCRHPAGTHDQGHVVVQGTGRLGDGGGGFFGLRSVLGRRVDRHAKTVRAVAVTRTACPFRPSSRRLGGEHRAVPQSRERLAVSPLSRNP
jgi:hypothetical protein